MTREELEDVLNKLATDSDFRAAVINSPITTLASKGIFVPASLVPPGGVVLPSESAIRSKLSELTTEFHTYGCQSWQFHLIWEPGYVTEP